MIKAMAGEQSFSISAKRAERSQRGRCSPKPPPAPPTPGPVNDPVAKVVGGTDRVPGLFGVGKSELAMVLLAPALGFPELFTLLIVTQVKHFLNIFLIFYLGEGWR